MESDAFVRCVVGPVGSGKSTVCVLEILVRALGQDAGPDGVRRTRFAVIRNTYSQLRDTTRKTFEQWIPQAWGTWHEQSFSFTVKRPLPDGTMLDCEVLFRALDRPEDVKKLLSLELTGAYINEGREIPKHVLDVLETRVGRYPTKSAGGASWFGIWMDTNPWHSGHWGAKLFARQLDGYALFRQPGGRSAGAENVENLPRGYYDRLITGKDREWVRVYVDGEDASGDVGSIWGAWVADLQKKGGICAFDHPMDGIYTSWDLGRSDATAIWFWRLNSHSVPDVIDHYENHGQGLSHFFNVVDSKPYKYAKHWLPHDARAKTLATQQSVLEQCIEHWGPGKVEIGPELSLVDGLQAARWLFEQPIQIHERCTVASRLEHSGVDALQEYRYEWDEGTQAFSNRPLHNWASHCFAPETEVLTRNGTCRMDMLPYRGEAKTLCGWKPYRNPRITLKAAPLVEVTFSDGHSVRCTPDHMFLTVCGWKSARSLTMGTEIRSSLTRSPRSSMGDYSVAGLRISTSRGAQDTCIDRSGRPRSARSQRDATSTTETETPRTIISTTWSAFRLLSIDALPWRLASPEGMLMGSVLGQGSELRSGIEAQRDGSGTHAPPSERRLGLSGREWRSLVSSAARRWLPWSESRGTRRNTAAPTVKHPRSAPAALTITSVTPLAERSDVWDLTVPGVEHFSLANGAIVHNSADAFRYLSLVVKHTDALTRKPVPKPRQTSWNLTQMFEEKERESNL